ncbi:hypothetical protein F5I97DRAFT_1866280 [Phlebopus sp. FC_14]|nr:hypothetical protein F5I97DRAFT_1866280 [Phlebopus sp. FC_14]
MIPKVANHLLLHTSRAVTLVQNQSGALRNVLQSGPATSTVPWGSGAGSSWGGTGAGPGGAKFSAGNKFYSGYTGPGRAITQANASTAQDGAESKDDDKDEPTPAFVAPRPSSSGPARSLHRRHSLSLPANAHSQEQPTAAGVLQTVQKHGPAVSRTLLSKRYNYLLESGGVIPSLGTYVRMIVGLTDRDQEVQKTLRSIENRSKRSRLWTPNNETLASEAEKKREALLSEENFQTAMKLFDAACMSVSSSAPNEPQVPIASQFPLSVYHGLLRSCAYHASIEAAIRVYSHLEARIRSSSPDPQTSSEVTSHQTTSATVPIKLSTVVLYHLLSTYVNAGDLAGAKEVFSEYQELSAKGEVSYWEPEVKIQTDMWNKMMEAHFKVGQPVGALRLLEQMLDAGAKGEHDAADAQVPSPSASTFTTILNGFCNPSPPVKPDVSTALSWFDRLLLQPTRPRDPYDPVDNPTRPDQSSWNVILEALSRSVLENDIHMKDLNRLFDVFVERASEDGLDIKAVHQLMVLHANALYLEKLTQHQGQEDVQERALASLHFIVRHFPKATGDPSRSLPAPFFVANTLARTFPYFVKYGMIEEGWGLAEALVAYEQIILERTPERENALPKFAKGAITRIAPVVLEAIAPLDGTDPAALSQALRVVRLVDRLGSLTPTMAARLLHFYLTAPAAARKELGTADTELVLVCAAALPAAYSSDPSQDCAYTSLPALLQTMHDSFVWINGVSSRVKLAVSGLLYASFSDGELAKLFSGLNISLRGLQLSHIPLKEGQAQGQRITTLSPPQTPPPEISPPPAIRVDAEISRHIDEWFPSHPTLTVNDAYIRLQEAISSKSPLYPHPTTLGRLINGLGRVHDLPSARSVYAIAQQVIFSPFLSQNPVWQSQAWFQIEDQMIIAHAHAGDMNVAFSHRDRITAAGGVPSPDAYGSLIECVKDTTDDTSNAMNLFTECQMLGTKPNVYLYNTMISKLAKARKADFALELFQQMKSSLRPSSITYGAVISACARVGDVQAAERLFEEMASQSNFKPRIPPYNTMMQMYTHTKPDRERVLAYYEKMKQANIRPSAHTYKLLIDAYGTIEPIEVGAMEAVFNEVRESPNVKLLGSHWAAVINAYGCVLKDLGTAISIFDSIATDPASKAAALPDAVTYESLINVLVTHKRMDLAQKYFAQLQTTGVHMTAYIANLLIKGHAASGNIDESRGIFESLADPPSGVAAPNNHVPHDSSPASSVQTESSVSYREPSTWEAMFRAELGNGDRDRAVALLERLEQRQFPPAVYNRIRGIMLDDSVSPWSQSPRESSPSPS